MILANNTRLLNVMALILRASLQGSKTHGLGFIVALPDMETPTGERPA